MYALATDGMLRPDQQTRVESLKSFVSSRPKMVRMRVIHWAASRTVASETPVTELNWVTKPDMD